MIQLPLQRLDWLVAWRHLRTGDDRPAWVLWVNFLSVYLIVAGGIVALYAYLGDFSGEPMLLSSLERSNNPVTPLQRNYGTFGALTVAVGVMGLILGVLALFFNLLPTIITMSVLLGCMALVVVLSLMSGLEEDLREKILNQKAHIKISRTDGRPFENYDPLSDALEQSERIAGASAYLEGEIMVRSGLNRQGAILSGIIPEQQTHVSNLRELLEDGDYRFLEHPEEIPVADPLAIIDEGTPWRLRHLEVERKKVIRESAEEGTIATDPPPSLEAALAAARSSADAASSAMAAAEATARVEADRAAATERAASEEPPEAPVPAPRELAFEEDDGWEDPTSEIPKLQNRGLIPLHQSPETEANPSAGASAQVKPEEEPPLDPILIGRELAMELGVRLGSEVQLITPIGRITPAGQIPGVLGATVAGVFFSGMYEYDRKNVYAPLPVVQHFLLTGDAVSGIEVKLVDADAIDAGKADVEGIVARLGRTDELLVEDWRDLNRNLFSAMFLEKVAMFIALLFVVLVASFGILASNLMSVMEKSKEIAILKAMGMSDGGIMRVFLAEGLCVGILGSLGGISMGLVLCATLDRFGLPINENVYYIEKLPVVVNPGEVVLVGLAAMVIVLISSVYPALVASRLRPVDALRQGDA